MTAPSTLSDNVPPQLDAQALARLRALDPSGRSGIVTRVLSTYEASLQRLLAQMADALAAGDVAGVGSVAHTLKSSSASVGALPLSALCAQVEQAVRSGQTADLVRQVGDLRAEGERALEAVRAILRA